MTTLYRTTTLALVAGMCFLALVGCGPQATAPATPAPQTSSEAEQAYLANMHAQGKAIPQPYCWGWMDRFGESHFACRYTGGVLTDGN